VQRKSAAVVYGFSPAGKFTQVWYDQWQSAVISSYGHALEEIGLNPYFIDAVSFARQALDGSIPDVICAFNLNAGITPIHHWSMVPDLSPKFPPSGGESLGFVRWPYAASLSMFIFSANSIGVRLPNAECGLCLL